MSPLLTPFRWPSRWKDVSALALLKETPIDCLVLDKGAAPEPVVAQAKQNGLQVVDSAAPPAGIFITEGVWPGVPPSKTEAADADSGPTGSAWVDSNGWKVRLETAQHPQSQIWVDAKPKEARLESYTLTIADAAAHGGRWIISLEDAFAADLLGKKPEAVAQWKKMAAASKFFADHKAWAGLVPAAVVGVISDYKGDNEFMAHEILNLIARTNEQYRVILKNKLSPASFANIKAVIYADATPPGPVLKSRIMAFVQAGGILITGPNWGMAPGFLSSQQTHPGYYWRTSGKGKIAYAKAAFEDPYVLANDAVLLVSHRHDLLRFFNTGSVGSFFTVTPDRRRAIVHLLFYADIGPDATAVQVAGAYKRGRMWTLDGTEPRPIEMIAQKDAVELRLPSVSQYAALELEA
jgi:hypothetical protein